VSDITESGHSD